MNTITLDIEIENNQTAFLPGRRVNGTVRWTGAEPPRKASLDLFWYTEGKGNEDAGLVEKITFETPQAIDTRTFAFQLPVGPWSFSGTLISLTWALELQVDKEVRRQNLVVSPTGEEILLIPTS